VHCNTLTLSAYIRQRKARVLPLPRVVAAQANGNLANYIVLGTRSHCVAQAELLHETGSAAALGKEGHGTGACSGGAQIGEGRAAAHGGSVGGSGRRGGVLQAEMMLEYAHVLLVLPQ
jgi:hypothetical protein